MPKLTIKEHSSSSYGPRTKFNAESADLTIAFATDFSTAGEKLTHKVAGSRYLGVAIDFDSLSAARKIYSRLRFFNATSINVAGNGIYTLAKTGISQEQINQFVFDAVKQAHTHWPISKIVSGGQTGVDLAGLVAAVVLDIPAVGTLPNGFIQRGLNGVDEKKSAKEIENTIIKLAFLIKD